MSATPVLIAPGVTGRTARVLVGVAPGGMAVCSRIVLAATVATHAKSTTTRSRFAHPPSPPQPNRQREVSQRDGYAPSLGLRLIEELQEVVGGQLQLLVPPLCRPELACNQPHPVESTKVSVAEAYRDLVSSVAPSTRPRCHSPNSSHE